eukprot:3145330-Lingulodinium_polyedra.AAC.1
MPGRWPGHRIWMYHSKWPPALRAAVSSLVIHACVWSCCDLAARTWNSGSPSAPPEATIAGSS